MVLDKSVFNHIFHIKINECCIFLGEDKIKWTIFILFFNLLEKYAQSIFEKIIILLAPKMKQNCKHYIFGLTMPSIFLKTFRNDCFHYIFLTCKLKYSKNIPKTIHILQVWGQFQQWNYIQHIHIEAIKPIPSTSCLLIVSPLELNQIH